MPLPSKTKLPTAFTVETTLEPGLINDLMLDVYHDWLEFALGKASIGGRMLKNPSGRYAAAITAKRNAAGHIVAIYINPEAEGAKEAYLIEHGHRRFDLKTTMLARKSKRSKEGFRYRRLNLRDTLFSPLATMRTFQLGRKAGIGATFRTSGRIAIHGRLRRMFSRDYKASEGAGTWVTMTDKRKRSWIIPAMPAFKPAQILRDQMPKELKSRIIVP